VLDTGKYFQATLIIDSEPGNYLSGVPFEYPELGNYLSGVPFEYPEPGNCLSGVPFEYPSNIRPNCKRLLGTNVPAYFDSPSVTKEKSFITLMPGVVFTILHFFPIYKWAQ
jgi:hypothetical protein